MHIVSIIMNLFPNQNIKKIQKGDFLISEPLLPDENFSRTVILVVDDTEGAHIGFVINKIYEANTLRELIDEYDGVDMPINDGGPVQKEIIQVVHQNANVRDSILIKDGVFWGGDFDQIRDLILTGLVSDNEFNFFIGYSGWGEGQLQEELSEKSWLVLRHNIGEILAMKKEDIWTKCIQLLGERFEHIAKFPVNPRLN